ncbi:LL-diaminopimelate aminotransferase [bacterium 1xD42-67]|nr:LL-diaminopimelate aminotransferase [bacterium 1xD42-67]
MVKVNENFLKLPGSYLFSEVARRIRVYSEAHPEAKIVKLSIGDVTRPLVPAVIQAMHDAVDEMGTVEGFHGYGPEQGYEFLRQAIAQGDYAVRGVDIQPGEIFVSDGAKSDCGNIGDIFGVDNVVAVCDPVYPVYVDTNAMAGRAGEYQEALGRWNRLIYMPCVESNGFAPEPPKEIPDIIYICSPNNPTGAVMDKNQLKVWVDYANTHGSVILYDSAYECFITSEGVPHTIFEIEGARTCAIEFRSFSKTAGFTGNRCAYTVVPMELERGGVKLNGLWNRRQCTKFNGVPYVVQRGAAAVYSPEGRAQVMANIDYYRANAQVIREGLTAAGMTCFGGVDAPYIWLKTPDGVGSWEFFDQVLDRANVATTPGAGFGPSGEGYVRLTAFGGAEDTKIAVERVAGMFRYSQHT